MFSDKTIWDNQGWICQNNFRESKHTKSEFSSPYSTLQQILQNYAGTFSPPSFANPTLERGLCAESISASYLYFSWLTRL